MIKCLAQYSLRRLLLSLSALAKDISMTTVSTSVVSNLRLRKKGQNSGHTRALFWLFIHLFITIFFLSTSGVTCCFECIGTFLDSCFLSPNYIFLSCAVGLQLTWDRCQLRFRNIKFLLHQPATHVGGFVHAHAQLNVMNRLYPACTWPVE